MINIKIENSWRDLCSGLELACIEADVRVVPENNDLWLVINAAMLEIRNKLTLDQISKIPGIASSRKAYKASGKDPARYRLSSEALLRRIVSGKELYRINNVVDQLNLVSVSTGFSIGGYDAKKIIGNASFGVATDEPYIGIGRGTLNIEGLPVFRDELGAFGTPTSDSERTSVTENTTRFLMIIINFGDTSGLSEAQEMAVGLLTKYCNAKNIEQTVIRC